MPPPSVPPISKVAAKWARRAAAAAPDFEEGVRTTPRSWSANAKAAEKNYQTAVTEAASKGRFGKGIDRAGEARWKERAATLGPARYSQGVGVAEPDYSKQFAPVLDLIGRTDLTPRGPAGAEGNFARSATLGRALHAAKVGR